MLGRTTFVRPLVLIYHGVPQRGCAGPLNATSFAKHMLFLKRHCTFVRPEEYATARGSLRRPALLLTFDDGLRNNAEVVAPMLRRLHIPAVFFISSRHCEPGKYLWFTYLRMLRLYFPGSGVSLNGSFIPLHGLQREKGLQDLTNRLLGLKPHPQAMYAAIDTQLPRLEEFVSPSALADECYGMTAEQLYELGNDPLFTVGGHTVDHPYLTRCYPQQVRRQVWENKTWLEHITGRTCNLFAYPLGDFDRDILEQCRQFKFQQAFATEWCRVRHRQFAIRRVGIYRGAMALLRIKIRYGHWLPMRLIDSARTFARALGLVSSHAHH
jgi:peptidoglycan/xylan/chitin deacetylase (PgdA/CDA1 family)